MILGTYIFDIHPVRQGARHDRRAPAFGQVMMALWLRYPYPDEECPCPSRRFRSWKPNARGCTRSSARLATFGGGRWPRTGAGAGSRTARARSRVIRVTARGSCGLARCAGSGPEAGSWRPRRWGRSAGSWRPTGSSRRWPSGSWRSTRRSARPGRRPARVRLPARRAKKGALRRARQGEGGRGRAPGRRGRPGSGLRRRGHGGGGGGAARRAA
jgi:hypothetical protein